MASHSKLWSPSGFKTIRICAGKSVLEQGAIDKASGYAAEGTVAHQVLTYALQGETDAAAFIDRAFHVDKTGAIVEERAEWAFTVDEDMAGHVQVHVDLARERMRQHPDAVLLVDTRVNFGESLGIPQEEDPTGTLDVAIIAPEARRLYVDDFKYGMGVEVSAGQVDEVLVSPNDQMALYALGALEQVEGIADIDEVHLTIVQPRIRREPSVCVLTVDQLRAWAEAVAKPTVAKAREAHALWSNGKATSHDLHRGGFLQVDDDACRFCKAKATCPALRETVAETVTGERPASPEDFAEDVVSEGANAAAGVFADRDADWLAACLAKVDLIEEWCKAIRVEAAGRLEAGKPVPGYKLVQGKQGNRAWSDAQAAEKLLRETFRLPIEKAYDLKLISPTTAEKLAKAGDIGERQWKKAQALITRTDGKPHVAPASDPRPAISVTPVVEDFDDMSAEDFA